MKWQYYIEGKGRDAEHIGTFDTIAEAMNKSIESVKITYDVDKENSTDPSKMPIVPQPKKDDGKKLSWDTSSDVFYKLPKEETKRNIILLATYDGETEYIVRSGKEDTVFL